MRGGRGVERGEGEERGKLGNKGRERVGSRGRERRSEEWGRGDIPSRQWRDGEHLNVYIGPNNKHCMDN